MFGFKDFLRLLRVEQWYKNIIIFISIIFTSNLFNQKMLFLTLLGFISLCFISSSSYIINDILDREKDKNHPEKKNRPIASGKIKKSGAITVSLLLFIASILIACNLSFLFLYSVLGLFILSQIYSLYIRSIAFLDIIFISFNFIIRAISGAFIIEKGFPISFWVVLCTFFLSMFLVSLKRSLEIDLKDAKKYRPSFKERDKKTLEILSIVAITCVFIFFCIYSILFEKPYLLISVPIALYIILMFFQGFYNCPEKIRNPEKFIFQKKIITAIILWILTIIIGFYIIT